MEIYLLPFITLALAHFVALLSPGVDFFLILANASKYGRVSGLVTSSGIAFANLVYILLALFGIRLIQDNPLIFITLKLLGSLYLLYIGYLLLSVQKRELFGKKVKRQENKTDWIRDFSMGFLSAILNPKNSIFYFTMFSITLQKDTPFMVQSFYALWMFLAVLFWDFFVVYLVTHQKTKQLLNDYTHYIEKGSGVILVLIAISILIDML